MRHRTVARAAFLLAAVFLAGAGLFAWLVSREAAPLASPASLPAREGAALFETHCASCHTADSLRPGVANADEARRRGLEAFLGHHGDADDADDRLILDYLSRN